MLDLDRVCVHVNQKRSMLWTDLSADGRGLLPYVQYTHPYICIGIRSLLVLFSSWTWESRVE